MQGDRAAWAIAGGNTGAPVIPKLDDLHLLAGDLEASLAFWSALLDLQPTASSPTGARFDLEGLRLHLVRDGLLPSRAPRASLAFGSDDLQAEVQRLRAAGLRLPDEPVQDGVLHLRDPSGHAVLLRQRRPGLPGPTTRTLHTGTPRQAGAVVAPIHRSTVFELGEVRTYGDIVYPRLSNTPSHTSLHAALAALEGAEAALSFASGMAAISTTLLSLLSQGDHCLAARTLYGGTAAFLDHEAPALGIAVTRVHAGAPETWEAARRPETRVLYLEVLSNPRLDVADLEAAVSFARQHGLLLVVDNTFLSPVNLRPLDLGAHLVVHSATKYLGGHSDVCAGVVAGSSALLEGIARTQRHLGGTLDPQAAFLLERGLKTLALRVDRQNRSALRLARFLAGHPGVPEVRYPGLRTHPGHALARRWCRGFGGMLSFRAPDPQGLFARLRLPAYAASLGGVESLVVLPAKSSHLTLSPEDRAAQGIFDDLVRVSVGCEEPEDLVADFAQALEGA